MNYSTSQIRIYLLYLTSALPLTGRDRVFPVPPSSFFLPTLDSGIWLWHRYWMNTGMGAVYVLVNKCLIGTCPKW